MTSARLVLDASVAVKWILGDEEDAEQAADLLEDLRRGAVDAVVPAHFLAELTNAAWVAIRRGRIGREDAVAGLGLVEALGEGGALPWDR